MKKQQPSKSWSEEELNFLRFAYPNKEFTTDEICEALNTRKHDIANKANSLGLKRPVIRDIPHGYKYCPSCDGVLPFSDFHKQSGKKDNLRAHCKWCRSKNSGLNIKKNTSDQTKKCSICNQLKPISEFGRNKNMKDGHLNQCKICVSKKARKRYIKGAY